MFPLYIWTGNLVPTDAHTYTSTVSNLKKIFLEKINNNNNNNCNTKSNYTVETLVCLL